MTWDSGWMQVMGGAEGLQGAGGAMALLLLSLRGLPLLLTSLSFPICTTRGCFPSPGP